MFDLDGTLVDTAPDLIACLNHALQQYSLPPVSDHQVRPFISYGASEMIARSVPYVSSSTQAHILDIMLDCYQHNVAEHSQLFTGMTDTLEMIEARGLKWGIITNKRERFTLPLVKALQFDSRAVCVISGDTTPHSKPHPRPMLTACEQAGVNAEECVYVGDALHDINAGKGVNMKTLVATYGYLKPDDQPDTWGADALIDSPIQLSDWVAQCH